MFWAHKEAALRLAVARVRELEVRLEALDARAAEGHLDCRLAKPSCGVSAKYMKMILRIKCSAENVVCH